MDHRDEKLNPRQILERRAMACERDAAHNLKSAEGLETDAGEYRQSAIEATAEAAALREAAARLSHLEPLPPEAPAKFLRATRSPPSK